MTNLFLFLILAALATLIFQLRVIIHLLEARNDFTNEDASVKASTEEVKEATKNIKKAKDRIPHGT